MTEDDAILARVVATLREPVRIDPDLDHRVMDEIERLPQPGTSGAQSRSAFDWLRRRRTIMLSPLGGLAAAATLAAVLLAGVRIIGGPDRAAIAPTTFDSPAGEIAQFVLVAPEAASVTVVGDFNDWSFSATPLERQTGDGVWWVTVPLPPGRYRYAFVVNGSDWRADPNAPTAEDEFGRENSVVTIGGA